MLDIVTKIFGAYTPNLAPDGTVLGGLYSINWTWIAGVVLFAICLISFFRILGVVIKRV